MLSDPIGDMLTRIRNSNLKRKNFVEFYHSNFKEAIIKVLQAEGFIEDFSLVDNKPYKLIRAKLKYQDNGHPVIRKIKRISKPSKRVKYSYRDLTPVMNSQGIRVVSTSSGVKSDIECRNAKIGGEVVCEVY